MRARMTLLLLPLLLLISGRASNGRSAVGLVRHHARVMLAVGVAESVRKRLSLSRRHSRALIVLGLLRRASVVGLRCERDGLAIEWVRGSRKKPAYPVLIRRATLSLNNVLVLVLVLRVGSTIGHVEALRRRERVVVRAALR